jgi:glutaminyl-tRNA synthetase
MTNFIKEIIDEDLKINPKVHTRFPPEPNGYLHIGHAKSICLNFGLANEYSGLCNLRFDDTNPTKENIEYENSIKEDIKWLGFDWENRLYYASDYFETLYNFALELIKSNNAFVDSCSAEEIKKLRGAPDSIGYNSPYRNRSIEENIKLFEDMKNGKFEDGTHVLRAKIDMSHPNIVMRDPIMFRIKKTSHHKTNNDWCIYPMYDFAHPISDWKENITHSICTLEFEIHRPLYDWFLNKLNLSDKPKQIEFARLNLNYTVMSKRKLLELVENKLVDGWDDPRMMTISGLRRRGYTPNSIKVFSEKIGVAKRNAITDMALLEHSIREDLNANAKRVMAVLKPLKLTITNFPSNFSENLETEDGRILKFSKNLYIENEDFKENPPKKYFRLFPGNEVRLKNAYIIKCNEIIKDEFGNVVEVLCTYDPETKSGNESRKVKGTIHWVNADDAVKAEIRLYDRLFTVENPDNEEKDFKEYLNPNSLEVLSNCLLEPSLINAKIGENFQFIRLGYFCLDLSSSKDKLIFNRTVSLKDNWEKK